MSEMPIDIDIDTMDLFGRAVARSELSKSDVGNDGEDGKLENRFHRSRMVWRRTELGIFSDGWRRDGNGG